MKKQVEKDHYTFGGYINKPRWSSMWHQLDEVLALEPETVLEIGPGPGVFKAVAKLFGPCVETLDLDPELKPDHVAPADEMPLKIAPTMLFARFKCWNTSHMKKAYPSSLKWRE